MSFRKRQLIIILLILFTLLIPIETTLDEDGIKIYSAILYKVIIWSTLDGDVEIEAYAFPLNFHDIEYYKNQRIQSGSDQK